MSPQELKWIEKSLLAREKVFSKGQKENTDCYRLFNGQGEGIPGLVIEQYGTVLIFQWHEGKCQLRSDAIKTLAQWYSDKLKIETVYLKRFISDRSKQNADQSCYNQEPFWGRVSEPRIVCHERGMKLEIHPFDGFSTGVFLDQRNNRAFLAELSRGQEVLNCFSYTCAFSVACARQGGFSTSIDLSKKYLEWGKRNFELNGLKSEEHPFYCVDVFEQFKRAKKMGKQYGLIILDPPSFSRTSQGKVFSLRSDLKRLIEEARDLLLPEGVIFFSCNLSSLTSEMLSQIVVKNLTAKGNRLERIELPSVPEDFTSLENPLSAVCFRLKS